MGSDSDSGFVSSGISDQLILLCWSRLWNEKYVYACVYVYVYVYVFSNPVILYSVCM